MNRTSKAALEYVDQCKASPELQLLRGELLLGLSEIAAAERQFLELAQRDDAIGRRALWLLCIDLLGRGEVSRAKKYLNANPPIARSVMGQELLAQILLVEGNVDEATQKLQLIQDESVQAKAFLARRAYAAGEWDESEQLTAQLTRELPDALQLRTNLRAINAAKSETKN